MGKSKVFHLDLEEFNLLIKKLDKGINFNNPSPFEIIEMFKTKNLFVVLIILKSHPFSLNTVSSPKPDKLKKLLLKTMSQDITSEKVIAPINIINSNLFILSHLNYYRKFYSDIIWIYCTTPL